MSDRTLWLAEWCPTCRTAPGARCRAPYLRKSRPPKRLHVARGSFAGQPQISGTVTWTTADRRVVIKGRRRNERFEEFV